MWFFATIFGIPRLASLKFIGPFVPPHDVYFVEKSYINITICMLTNISLVPIHMYMLCLRG